MVYYPVIFLLSYKVKRVNCFGSEVWLKMEQHIFTVFSKKQRELVIDFFFIFLMFFEPWCCVEAGDMGS